VVEGEYRTAINILDPNFFNGDNGSSSNNIENIVAYLTTEGTSKGEGQSVCSEESCGGDFFAFEVDCEDLSFFDSEFDFFKGFVRILAAQRLDVTAVYTAKDFDDSGSESSVSIDVEQIWGRKIKDSNEKTNKLTE
jgi:hypothetical protein